MVSVKPLIPGRLEGAVITVVKSMIQLVEETTQPEFDTLANQQILKPAMRGDRRDRLELHNE